MRTIVQVYQFVCIALVRLATTQLLWAVIKQLLTLLTLCNCKQNAANILDKSFKVSTLEDYPARETLPAVITMPPPRRPGPKSGGKKRVPASSSPSPAAKSKRNDPASVEGESSKTVKTKEEHFQVTPKLIVSTILLISTQSRLAVPCVTVTFPSLIVGCVEGIIVPAKERGADRPPVRHGRQQCFQSQEEGRPWRRDRLGP